jgi:MFS family permease
MGKIILGIVVGFIVWSVLWVGSDAVLMALSPDWYGKHQTEFENAVNNQTPFTVSSTILIIGLIRSVIFSIISGFLAALIAKENTKSTLGLGILLLLFGIFVQSIFWNYVPLWYHIPFLLLLIPMTILGGKLKKL